MYLSHTQRRGPVNRLRQLRLLSLICLLTVSPFVLNRITTHSFSLVSSVHAYNYSAGLTNLAQKSGFTDSQDRVFPLPYVIGAVIKSLFALLGVIFLIWIIVAGLRWMWSGGDEETIKKAKQTISNAAIGAIISMGAYAIVSYVLGVLLK